MCGLVCHPVLCHVLQQPLNLNLTRNPEVCSHSGTLQKQQQQQQENTCHQWGYRM
jgi:hypothetical protein